MTKGPLLPKGISVFLLMLTFSCSPSKKERAMVQYQTYCASCHLAPSMQSLPKHIWAQEILPDMGARLGIRDAGYNPMKGESFEEQEAIIKSGIYPYRPSISKADWESLKAYIISMAPDTLPPSINRESSGELNQFTPQAVALDSAPGSLITFLDYSPNQGLIRTADIAGNLLGYSYTEKKKVSLHQFGAPIIDFTETDSLSYATSIGYLNPSEIPSGKVIRVGTDTTETISGVLHRPVHTLVCDLNKNGRNELVVSEFGNYTGQLSLLAQGVQDPSYRKTVLLQQPGAIRVIAKDMDQDGLEDLVVLTSQGDESITILYQQEDLQFKAQKVIRFSPVYGSSWFELVDFDGDGDDDMITVHGDNADKSYVHKPYHGMRIHINTGENVFEERYFYPLNGTTRVVAEDFDQDGDVDFGLLSTFPDYDQKPEYAFVYLENMDAAGFVFKPYTFADVNLGRWLLMDSGDVDQDGDMDIVLSAFSYGFTPVPESLSKIWTEKSLDLMVLENKLK
ncbi:FG-GAP repeat domain-containing protein [Spongiimicrobium sp. 2-473A-2-J]|uniref:FG-GAP repeat domain-containing protein n=1 Tax=Eudoraea algarum TaxID=3417568 RepID=UPI003D3650E3